MTKGMMKFAAFMMADSNYHIAGWRHPESYADAGSNIQRWVEFARILERGKLDMLFVADTIGVPGASARLGPSPACLVARGHSSSSSASGPGPSSRRRTTRALDPSNAPM